MTEILAYPQTWFFRAELNPEQVPKTLFSTQKTGHQS